VRCALTAALANGCRRGKTSGIRQLNSPSAKRFLLAILLAALAGTWTAHRRALDPLTKSDLMPVVSGAGAWERGENPYTTVRSGNFPPLYPFPALLLLTPIAGLPMTVVDPLWVVVSAGLLAWDVTRERLLAPALLLFLSAPFAEVMHYSQWSALMLAGALLPWGGWIVACKPTTAIWLFAYRPTIRNALLGVSALAFSLALWPTWIPAWRHAVDEASWTFSLVALSPGGLLPLLALLKWRRPEARLLAAMACVPHTTLSYELLPLFLVPATWAEAAVIWLGTTVLVGMVPGPLSVAKVAAVGGWSIWLVYLPALIMVLRRRNVRAGSEQHAERSSLPARYSLVSRGSFQGDGPADAERDAQRIGGTAPGRRGDQCRLK